MSLGEIKGITSHSSIEDLQNSLSHRTLELALEIRAVETYLLRLFQNGEIAGTIHTCVGQELVPAYIATQLRSQDFFTSNHRCHGHYIAKTADWKGLILEIMGSRDGVCRGIGSSQHLAGDGFLSNGPQASLLPVGTGIAYSLRGKEGQPIVFSFIGEGTLGEGLVYESMNFSMITSSPQLFVCENNFYSQSTPQDSSVSGKILERAIAFGMKTFCCNIWNISEFTRVVSDAILFVREHQKPAFLLVQCYRLMAHSKGDDTRDQHEIDFFHNRDPLQRLIENSQHFSEYYSQRIEEIESFVSENLPIESLTFKEYAIDSFPKYTKGEFPVKPNEKIRCIESIRSGIYNAVSEGAIILGEDILDPYGGAFKATKGISISFPNSVINAPISEAAIVGFAIGTALVGRNVFAEIMFGDFITYAFDQIVSNASKFLHVYNLTGGLPLIIRVPNGGHRGYGPTHSQSLEKHFLGLDNILVLANTSLTDTSELISRTFELKCPTILIENKIGYPRMLYQNLDSLKITQGISPFSNMRFSSGSDAPDITIICYGEMARDIVEALIEIELLFDVRIEVICVIQLHPLRVEELMLERFGKIVIVVEEGSKSFGFGSEIAALILEGAQGPHVFRRLAAEPFPIASNLELEDRLLPNVSKLKEIIKEELINGKI